MYQKDLFNVTHLSKQKRTPAGLTCTKQIEQHTAMTVSTNPRLQCCWLDILLHKDTTDKRHWIIRQCRHAVIAFSNLLLLHDFYRPCGQNLFSVLFLWFSYLYVLTNQGCHTVHHVLPATHKANKVKWRTSFWKSKISEGWINVFMIWIQPNGRTTAELYLKIQAKPNYLLCGFLTPLYNPSHIKWICSSFSNKKEQIL